MDDQTLRELILGELRERPAELLEIASQLDQNPADVLQVLREMEAEERVVQVPRWGWEWGMVE